MDQTRQPRAHPGCSPGPDAQQIETHPQQLPCDKAFDYQHWLENSLCLPKTQLEQVVDRGAKELLK
jgi:hypothetical protein